MRSILLTLLTFGIITASMAQKYAYIDTDFILNKVPEYTQAQETLDELSKTYVREIETMKAEVEEIEKKYQEEKILLPAETQEKREAEIAKLQQDVRDLQRQRFGVEGDLYKKREELIKPIQERLSTAIQKVAEQYSYTFIFDKANQSNLLYADPKYDKSDQVLKKMGVSSK